MAIHDWKEYSQRDPSETIRETREIVLQDDAIDQLTLRRLRLLLHLGSKAEPASIRDLARSLGRDVKNVSEDVAALATLGFVESRGGGRGRASAVRMPADRIDLHLVEPSRATSVV